MGREFCTLFDGGYLTRGLALARSLQRVAPDAHLTVFCFDEDAKTILDALALPNVTTVALAELEAFDPELLAVKSDRSVAEYCWTATPCVLRYVLETRPEVMEVTYLDADLLFFADPEPVFTEMGDASVLITPHRFPPHLQSAVESTGIYNVQFMTFRRTPEGLTALMWWRERVLEWCYATPSEGRMGDQKYLDDWPERFGGVHVLEHPGGGLAPWNVGQYDLGNGPTVDGRPALFFHFHALKLQRDGRHHWRHQLYQQSLRVRKLFYDPYFAALDAALDEVRTVRPGFDRGFADPIAGPDRLRTLMEPKNRVIYRGAKLGRRVLETTLRRTLGEDRDPYWQARLPLLGERHVDRVVDLGDPAYVDALRARGWSGPAGVDADDARHAWVRLPDPGALDAASAALKVAEVVDATAPAAARPRRRRSRPSTCSSSGACAATSIGTR
jgi:hypothetical protein